MPLEINVARFAGKNIPVPVDGGYPATIDLFPICNTWVKNISKNRNTDTFNLLQGIIGKRPTRIGILVHVEDRQPKSPRHRMVPPTRELKGKVAAGWITLFFCAGVPIGQELVQVISPRDNIPRQREPTIWGRYGAKNLCLIKILLSYSVVVTVDCRLISGLWVDGRDNTIMCRRRIGNVKVFHKLN